MSASTVTLYSRYDRPNMGFTSCGLDLDPSARAYFFARESVTVRIVIYDGDTVLNLTGLTAARLTAKITALTGTPLFTSTNMTSTAAQLLAGVLQFSAVDLNTVEVINALGTNLSLIATVSAVELVLGSEDRILAQGNVEILADVDTGGEGTPTHALDSINAESTVDPTANDDSDDGYSYGSVWVNTTSGAVFYLQDPTVGHAVWVQGWLSGVQGAQGFRGFQGVVGSQGNQGAAGPQGTQGFQGIIGTQGTQGPSPTVEEFSVTLYNVTGDLDLMLTTAAPYAYTINTMTAYSEEGTSKVTIFNGVNSVGGLTDVALTSGDILPFTATTYAAVSVGSFIMLTVRNVVPETTYVMIVITLKVTRT